MLVSFLANLLFPDSFHGAYSIPRSSRVGRIIAVTWQSKSWPRDRYSLIYSRTAQPPGLHVESQSTSSVVWTWGFSEEQLTTWAKLSNSGTYRFRPTVAGALEAGVHGLHHSWSMQKGGSIVIHFFFFFISRTLRCVQRTGLQRYMFSYGNNCLNLALTQFTQVRRKQCQVVLAGKIELGSQREIPCTWS